MKTFILALLVMLVCSVAVSANSLTLGVQAQKSALDANLATVDLALTVPQLAWNGWSTDLVIGYVGAIDETKKNITTNRTSLGFAFNTPREGNFGLIFGASATYMNVDDQEIVSTLSLAAKYDFTKTLFAQVKYSECNVADGKSMSAALGLNF